MTAPKMPNPEQLEAWARELDCCPNEPERFRCTPTNVAAFLRSPALIAEARKAERVEAICRSLIEKHNEVCDEDCCEEGLCVLCNDFKRLRAALSQEADDAR